MDHTHMAKELIGLVRQLKSNRDIDDISRFAQGEMLILDYLVRASGKGYSKDMCRDLNLSSARVTIIINGLEKKGFVKRDADEHDSRKVVVSVTDKGYEIFEKESLKTVERVKDMLEFLGDEDAQTLIRINKKLTERFNRL